MLCFCVKERISHRTLLFYGLGTYLLFFIINSVFPVFSELWLTLLTHCPVISAFIAIKYMQDWVKRGNSLIVIISSSLSSLSFLRQDATGWTQSTEMLLSDEDGSEKEITPVRQSSRTPAPINHCSYTN